MLLKLKKTLGNKLLIRETTVEHTSAGGIVMPATAGEKFARFGTVISKGDEVSEDIRVGSTVIFDRFHATHLIDGQVAKLVPEDQVYCVVERVEEAS